MAMAMTATNHGLFGAVIAISLQKYPAIAIVVAILSHFLLDAIPHYGGLKGEELKTKKFFRNLSIDAVLAVITTLVIAWAWPEAALLIVVCAFLAASPDLLWAYYQYAGVKYMNVHLLPRFHTWVQWSEHKTGVFVYTDVIWFLIFFPTIVLIGTNSV